MDYWLIIGIALCIPALIIVFNVFFLFFRCRFTRIFCIHDWQEYKAEGTETTWICIKCIKVRTERLSEWY